MKNEKISLLDQNDVLEEMAQELVDNDIAAKFEKATDEDPAKLYVLFTEFGFASEEVMGQFYFEDQSENTEGMLYLTSLFILDDVEVNEHFGELCHSIAVLNGKLPCGAFGLTLEDDALAYKLVTPISEELSYDQLNTQLNIVMNNAMYVAETYFDVLVGVKKGELSTDDVKAALSAV